MASLGCRGSRESTAQRAASSHGGADGGSDRRAPGWDWNGVVGTGQSLSVGSEASAVSLTRQPFKNLKLSLGRAALTMPPYPAGDPSLSVVPLTEPIRPEVTRYPSAYPFNIYGETPHTAMGDEVSALWQRDHGGDYVTVHTVVGESGQGIDVIDKSAVASADLGHAYAATLFEVTALKRLAAAAGKTYGVGAVLLTHGETDAGNADYERRIIQLAADYDADLRAITGQNEPIPLFLTQQQTCPTDDSSARSTIAQWKAALDAPGRIVCVGPKYAYPYAADGLHLVASGYDRLGEKYGEVYYERVVLGRDWQPLQPRSATLRGAVLTVTFHVPVPPLAWEESIPAPHQTAHAAWARGRGFEVQNRSGEQTIASVGFDGASVVITLSSAPNLEDLVVRYAITQDGHGSYEGGRATGRVGQLRDSDPLVGTATHAPQYNYGVSFSMPVSQAP